MNIFTNEAKLGLTIIFVLWSAAMIMLGSGIGKHGAQERIKNELYQAQCKEAGGQPAFNGRWWDCLGVKLAKNCSTIIVPLQRHHHDVCSYVPTSS